MLFIKISLAVPNRTVAIGIASTIATALPCTIVPTIVIEYVSLVTHCIVAYLFPMHALYPCTLEEAKVGAGGVCVGIVEDAVFVGVFESVGASAVLGVGE